MTGCVYIIRNIGFLLAILVVIVFVVRGCVESRFELHHSSRLPSWYVMHGGLERKDIDVNIVFYTMGRVGFELKDNSGVVKKYFGYKRWHPVTIRSGFVEKPIYLIIEVGGIGDIYEQRYTDGYLYIVDVDPAIIDR